MRLFIQVYLARYQEREYPQTGPDQILFALFCPGFLVVRVH